MIIWWLGCEGVEDPVPLNTNKMLACFEVKRVPRTGDHFYLCARKILVIVIDGPSFMKKWNKKLFYAGFARFG